jgi:hypothetical protein
MHSMVADAVDCSDSYEVYFRSFTQPIQHWYVRLAYTGIGPYTGIGYSGILCTVYRHTQRR